MENITIKLNLLAFVHAEITMKGKEGNPVKGVFIPYEKNNVFIEAKGNYFDIIAFPFKNKQADSKETHLMKQSFSKEQREAMTKEQIDAQPIFGNLVDYNCVQPQTTDQSIDTTQAPAQEPGSDLPF